ncbi:MAG: basic amino acid ABC transporter substrate-binding protein [Candidatus Aerophobetes bacterium]|nr:basic amino acid ABC transporter substrate-binding protein [Candidatus Aerophobetes bacterium]
MRGKKLMLVLALSVAALMLIFGGSTLWAQGEKVYIDGIDPDFPPFSYIDEEGNPAGFDVEAVKWIAKEMGFEVKVQPTAWDAIIPSLKSGKIDLIASGMTITEEREKVVDFTIPYWEIDQAVTVREESELNIINALSGKYIVGTERGCTAAMWIEDHLVKEGIIGKDKLKLYEGFSLAVKDLLNRRIDSAMMDDVMVEHAIKGKPLKIIGIIKTGEIYGYAVRKEDKELKRMLNEGLRKLMKSDKWDELIAKYMVK